MNYNFHGQYSEQDKILFESAQKEDLKKICKYLDTDPKKLTSIKFEIFDTREGKQNGDPHHSISRASARFSEMTIYRFWKSNDDPHFPHETTHLVAHTWAKPYQFETELDTWDNKKIKKIIEMVSTSFMQEGLAVAVDDIVFQRKLNENGELKFIDDWCREQINRMPPTLTGCINLEGFGSFENKVIIPFSASLSKYLLQTFGIGKYKEVYTQLKETVSPETNVKVIEDIYKLTEAKLLSNWKKSL